MFVGVDLFSFIAETIEQSAGNPTCDMSVSSRLFCFVHELNDLLSLPEVNLGFGGQTFPLDLKALVNSCYLNHQAFRSGKQHSHYKFVCQLDLKLRVNRESIGLPFFYRNLVVFDDATSSLGVVAKNNFSMWSPSTVSEIINTSYMRELRGKSHDQLVEMFKQRYKKKIRVGPGVAASPDEVHKDN
jgi:hypothetical protein